MLWGLPKKYVELLEDWEWREAGCGVYMGGNMRRRVGTEGAMGMRMERATRLSMARTTCSRTERATYMNENGKNDGYRDRTYLGVDDTKKVICRGRAFLISG